MHAYHTPSTVRFLYRFLLQTLFCFVLSVVVAQSVLAQEEGTSESPDSTPQLVIINFDTLQTNVGVPSNQYPTATFSTYPGASISTVYDGNLNGSYPNGIQSTQPGWPNADLYVHFTLPVTGLTFRMLNSQGHPYSHATIDAYSNGSFYQRILVTGNGQPNNPIVVNAFSSIPHLTDLVIQYISNTFDIDTGGYYQWPFIYDDFAFTPEISFNITNPRISGNLDSTVRNALVGSDVSLQVANANPSGGTYLWTFTGSPTVVSGGSNQSTIKVRWTETGTYRATMTYKKNGVSIQSFVDINVLIPTLSSFSAVEVTDQLTRDLGCSNQGLGVTHSLGCYQAGGPEDGIIWSSSSQIPAGDYLSDPAQSGVKFVQATSVYRKRLRNGNFQCFTARSSQGDINSGWQLDTVDPYNHIPQHPPLYFSQGNTLTMSDLDAPSAKIEGTTNGVFFSDDARYESDNFEVYVYYFTTDPSNPDPAHPIFQRAMALQGSSYPYAKLPWSWGGQAQFNYFSNPSSLLYSLVSGTTAGSISAIGTNTVPSLTSNVNTLTFNTCPGTTSTTNPIDGSRFFVMQQYLDFLSRPADDSGLNYWRTNITQCGFDASCIGSKRVDVSRAFFYSSEFIGLHPELAGQRGTHDYNSSFVYWCYRAFLRREPNGPPDNNWDGFNFWVGTLDATNPDAGDWKYNQALNAFLSCSEYRSRF